MTDTALSHCPICEHPWSCARARLQLNYTTTNEVYLCSVCGWIPAEVNDFYFPVMAESYQAALSVEESLLLYAARGYVYDFPSRKRGHE